MPFDQAVSAAQAHARADQKKTQDPQGGSPIFWAAKRVFDILVSLLLLVLVAGLSLALLLLNPLFNRGGLFFIQERMGRDCEPFKAIKFRTMTRTPITGRTERGAGDPLELDRITPLGQIMRKTRIDELPQVLNVLAGQMSLIGPRPDAYDHASDYLKVIPRYRDRHRVRPGISGLAQVTLGYAAGYAQTRAKANVDLIYIREAGFLMEAKVFWLTLVTVFLRRGA